MKPGMILDLFFIKRKYDLAMHWLQEKDDGGAW